MTYLYVLPYDQPGGSTRDEVGEREGDLREGQALHDRFPQPRASAAGQPDEKKQ